MPTDATSRRNRPLPSVLNLPPPFRAIALREVGDAFVYAEKIAADAGAGTLVHVERFDLAEFAVVLEPAEPLHTARRAIYVGMAALVDALAAQAPPEKPITIDWPDAIRIDGGLVGGGRLGWPPGADEDSPPSWLVFGAMIRTVMVGEQHAGLRPLAAAPVGEGFSDSVSDRLLEGFARHLMVTVDAWQQDGFNDVAKRYLARLTPEKGAQCDLDDNGDMLVRRDGQTRTERHALVQALAKPSWHDPATGGPRL